MGLLLTRIKTPPRAAGHTASVVNTRIVTLDVRPDLEQGREPFGRIMDTVARLQDGEQLRLLAPFQPVPLYRVMKQRGFRHESRPIGAGSWEVIFSRDESGTVEEDAAAETAGGPVCPGRRELLEIDARGLEPPEPLVVILEAVACLPDNADLVAYTDRQPVHLHPQLEERGFTGRTEKRPDGSFATLIRRV